ncbi:MAG: hypothetical protein AAF968_11105 [Pseudomonadota bacterium]
MSSRKDKFTQSDLTRALKAARDAGIPVARYEIDQRGKVTVYTTSAAADDAPNAWDD